MRGNKFMFFVAAFFVLVSFIFALLFSDFSVNLLTGFATVSDSSAIDFNQGNYVNTTYNGTALVLDSSYFGTFQSRIFDVGFNSNLNNLSYTGETPSFNFIYSVDNSGYVYSSLIDNLTSWKIEAPGYGRVIDTQEMFSDSNYLYIISSINREVWRSKDAKSWSVINNTFADSNLLVAEASPNGDLFIADASGDVYMSTDFGASWQLKGDFNGASNSNAKGMGIGSSGDIFIVDSSKSVWKSNDSGVTWTEMTNNYGGSPSNTNDLEADSLNNLYIIEKKKVWKSTDSGANWNVINNSFTNRPQNGLRMHIDKNDIFYITDSVGRVFKSTDYGITWTEKGDINGPLPISPQGITDFYQNSSISFMVMNCTLPDCSDGTWQVKDISNINLKGQYFRYEANLSSPTNASGPYITSVTLDYTYADQNPPEISFTQQTTSSGEHKQNFIFVEANYSDESQGYGFINFNNSLVGFYKLNDTSGTVKDYSGKGNDANASGFSSVIGRFGKALKFDGSSGYADIAYNDEDHNFSRTKGFTVSSWVRPNFADGGDGDIITHYYSVTNDRVWGLQVRNGKARFLACSNGTLDSCVYSTGTTTLNKGKWYNIAGRWNGTNIDVFLNGVAEDSGSDPLTTIHTTSIRGPRIARQAAYKWFNGTIDEVLIFKRALSDSEIKALYNASLFSNNFTNLSEGNYSFYAYSRDFAGNENQTAARTVTLSSNLPPNITIISPISSVYSYNTSIPLNYTVHDEEGNLDSCWYSLNDAQNISLPNCQNSTLNLSNGNYTLKIYANDTKSGVGIDEVSFEVRMEPPRVDLIYPLGETLNSQLVKFKYALSDLDLSYCELWGNFTGIYSKNQTNFSVENGNNSFYQSLIDGSYLWNVRCVDAQQNENQTSNGTFLLDTMPPNLTIIEPKGTKTQRTNIPLIYTVNDALEVSCRYNVTFSTGLEVISNTQLPGCNNSSFDLSTDGDYIVYLTAEDNATNVQIKNSSFSVSTSGSSGGGSSGGGSSSGGGGGGSGGGGSSSSSSISRRFEIKNISAIFTYNEEKMIKVSVKNKWIKTINKCRLVPSREFEKSVESDEVKNIGAGELVEFLIRIRANKENLNNLRLNISCLDNVTQQVPLSIKVIKPDIDFSIEKMEVSGNSIRIDYAIGSPKEIILQVIDEEGEIISKEKFDLEDRGTVELSLEGAKEGMLKVQAIGPIGETILEEQFLFTGTGPTGFVARNINVNNSITFSIILIFIIAASFIIWRIIKLSRKKNS